MIQKKSILLGFAALFSSTVAVADNTEVISESDYLTQSPSQASENVMNREEKQLKHRNQIKQQYKHDIHSYGDWANYKQARLDKKGDIIDHRLDHKGERINDHLDRRAELADSKGYDRVASYLDSRGDRIEHRLDVRGDVINRRLDIRGERLSHRTPQINRIRTHR